MQTSGAHRRRHPSLLKGYAAMELLLFFLVFVLLLALASALGLSVDSRDSADWKPTVDGRRWRSRPS
jgi:hypothetical protein